MPKRSNQFQRVVTYIAEKLAPSGATVRESVELPERGLASVDREVDTLIEVEVGITLVRVAVESRDRTRKDVVAWIDELIGKYKNLAVDRILAVSSSGFSAAAKAKAALNGIDLLTPEEVEGIDWPARFQKLGVTAVLGHAAIEHVEFQTVPPFAGRVDVDRDTVLREVDSKRVQSSVRKFIEELTPIMTEQAKRFHRANYFSVRRTRADLDKAVSIEIEHEVVPGVWLLSQDSRYRIEHLHVRVRIIQRATMVPGRHQPIGDSAIPTSATLDDVAMTIAQAANADGGKVFVERVTKKKKEKKKGGRRK
jgi:hypothetical protein